MKKIASCKIKVGSTLTVKDVLVSMHGSLQNEFFGENIWSHPAASRILPITEKQKKENEAAERRSIMARSAAVNETYGSNSTTNETMIVLGENCDETNIEVWIKRDLLWIIK